MRRFASFLILCAILASPVASRAGTAPDACAAPDAFVTATGAFSQLAAAIAAGGPVAILAVGSATTVGAANRSGEPTSATQGAAFPWHMLRALEAASPGSKFSLTVRGGRGMTAADMLPLISAALAEQHYALVLWQTGTVEAVRGLRPDGVSRVLREGVELAHAAAGDVVLVDPQFSRFLRANTDLDPYESVLRQTATLPGVALFRRFDLMRAWVDEGRVDLERTAKPERDAALELLNRCLGQALARFILSGVEKAKQ